MLRSSLFVLGIWMSITPKSSDWGARVKTEADQMPETTLPMVTTTKPAFKPIPKWVGEKRVTLPGVSWQGYQDILHSLPQNPTFPWVEKENLYRFLAQAQTDEVEAELRFREWVRQRLQERR
jgi:hypothetical protein